MTRSVASSADIGYGAVNLAVMTGAVIVATGCLWAATHASSPLAIVAAAILFAFVNNTIFSLMHEAVHGVFHESHAINEAAGHFTAAFFPTIFVIQRLSHLTHHRNNRSENERFDYYEPGDSHLLKTAQWYSILTGLYWLFIPAFTLVYALFGGIIPWRKIVATDGFVGRQTSAKAYFDSLQRIPMTQIWLGFILTLAVQAALFGLLGLSLVGWAVCYACFGLMWSSLQYADHAFTALDCREGAWNLKVSTVTRLLFLNYHYHLSHHREAQARWRELPRRPGANTALMPYTRMLFFMWAGPRLKPGAQLPARQLARNALTVNLFLTALMMLAFAAVYGAGEALYARADVRFDFTTALDHAMPFYPAAAFVYLCVTPLLLAAPFVFRTPERLLPFGAAVLVELLAALAIYYVAPAEGAQVSYDSGGLIGGAMWLADAINLDGNSMPSLHVALATSAAWGYAPYLRTGSRRSVYALAAAIAASTLLTHQHVIADVVAGAALAAFGMGVIYPRAQGVISDMLTRLGAAAGDGGRVTEPTPPAGAASESGS
jgi:fatty acid desaturase